MSDAWIGVDESPTIDKRLDAESLLVGAVTVLRERIRLAGDGETYAGVNSIDELLVHDGDVDAALAAVVAALAPLATQATLAAVLAALDAPLSTRASEATLGAVLTELGQKYEGGPIALDAGTLAALESITVTVTNPTTSPETGLAKETTLDDLRDRTPRLVGTPGYQTEVSGLTCTIPANGRLLGVWAYAVGADGTFDIDGGDAIMVRQDSGREWNPVGNYGAGTVLTFATSLDYLVEWVVG